MTTTTAPPDFTTTIPCPSWCKLEHDDGPGAFHAGATLFDLPTALIRIWQQDSEGAKPGVVIAGQLLSEAETHELGMALVRAGDVMRREAGR